MLVEARIGTVYSNKDERRCEEGSFLGSYFRTVGTTVHCGYGNCFAAIRRYIRGTPMYIAHITHKVQPLTGGLIEEC